MSPQFSQGISLAMQLSVILLNANLVELTNKRMNLEDGRNMGL